MKITYFILGIVLAYFVYQNYTFNQIILKFAFVTEEALTIQARVNKSFNERITALEERPSCENELLGDGSFWMGNEKFYLYLDNNDYYLINEQGERVILE